MTVFPSKRGDTLARLRAIGRELYGDENGENWRTKLAKALHVSRPTVNSWDAEKFRPADRTDLDRLLLELLREEHVRLTEKAAASAETRAHMIAVLQKLVGDDV